MCAGDPACGRGRARGVVTTARGSGSPRRLLKPENRIVAKLHFDRSLISTIRSDASSGASYATFERHTTTTRDARDRRSVRDVDSHSFAGVGRPGDGGEGLETAIEGFSCGEGEF